MLLVHNAWRREWELPGGTIERRRDRRARPRSASSARRPGVEPGEVEFVGVGTVQLGHERRIEYAAVYRTDARRGRPSSPPNDEIDRGPLVGPGIADVPGLSAIDAHLAQLAVEPAGAARR